MKRLASLLMALALLLAAAALAEPAAETTVLDLDDFTLTVPANTVYETSDKANNVVFMQLSSPTGSNSNLNCVWAEQPMDLALYTQELFELSAKPAIEASMEEAGIGMTNLTFAPIELKELNGVPVLYAGYSYDADYSPLGYDLQLALNISQFIASREDLGTYTFTITWIEDDTEAYQALMDIVDSVSWK